MHGKSGEVWLCSFWDMWADTQTDRHSHHNTAHPSWGQVTTWPILLPSLAFTEHKCVHINFIVRKNFAKQLLVSGTWKWWNYCWQFSWEFYRLRILPMSVNVKLAEPGVCGTEGNWWIWLQAGQSGQDGKLLLALCVVTHFVCKRMEIFWEMGICLILTIIFR